MPASPGRFEPAHLCRRCCPACDGQELQALAVLVRDGEPPATEGHGITYFHRVIVRCAACGTAFLERRDHDCFQLDEVWDQLEWHVLGPADAVRLAEVLASCPSPLDPGCACEVHAALRDSAGKLPRSGWESALEAEAHIHPARLESGPGGLRIVPS